MLYVRNALWLKRGLTVFCLVALVNHGEFFLRQRLRAAHSAGVINLNVQSEGGLGHNSIGIDEQSLTGPEAERFLHFSTLGQWEFAVSGKGDRPPPCPPPIQGLSGQRFSSVGFMYPLEAGERIKSFCLLRSTQTCCYGPKPQFNQYILVETKTPVAFARLSPVLVNGKFFVDPKPDDGYIYRMEADTVRSVDEDTPDIDPVSAAKQMHLPLFDYAPLTAMAAARPGTPLPPALLALSGKTAVVTGYCVHRTRSALPRLMVARAWWDGVAQGERPTIYNSVVTLPADAQQLPPLWKPYQTFTGEIRVTTDPARWKEEGIVQLCNAHLGVPGVTPIRVNDNAPYLPWEAELLLLGLILFRSLGWRLTAPQAAANRPRLKSGKTIRR